MKIAAAQTKPERYNIEANLSAHYDLIKLAAANRLELIAFPEMSLTGYEREKAANLSLLISEGILEEFRKLASLFNIVIVAGAPVSLDSQLYIASLVFVPGKQMLVYTKQFLHEGEEKFFASTKEYNPCLVMKEQRISFAICSDISHPEQ